MTRSSLPDPFHEERISIENEEFRYACLNPERVQTGELYPLVLFLHGAGERGNNPADVLAHFPVLMGGPYRQVYPSFVLSPQCRDEKFWARIHWRDPAGRMADEPGSMMKMVMAILDHSLATLPIDPNRVYLTGLSMGGFGCWELATRRPTTFAAVAPICGGGDPDRVAILKNVPIWAFHGADDNVVDVIHSRRLIDALRKIGANPRYTEYPHAGHHSWVPAYDRASGLLDWMFAQRRIPDIAGRLP
jgi:predicted peptidase